MVEGTEELTGWELEGAKDCEEPAEV